MHDGNKNQSFLGQLRRSLSKSGPVRFGFEKSISFKLCPGIYLSLKVIESTLVFADIAKYFFPE